MERADSVLIVAGEVSGDIHAGNLLRELRSIRPDVTGWGVGGERLRAAGLECVVATEELSHMGLVEVLRELPRLRGILDRLVADAARRRPKLAVLVDSPDFNLRLAERLGSVGVESVLYVSPQLWAWRQGRVRTVRRVAREVLCLLPFEVPFYERHRVAARYVGHPLVDDVAHEGLLGVAVESVTGRIGLLPGSRRMEVRQLLPAMLAGLRRLDRATVTEALLVQAPGVASEVEAARARHGWDDRLRVVAGDGRRRALATCSAAWTASGTATLECALLDVPMVVGYRLAGATFALARLLVRVPHVGLVNLIAAERIAPELLQGGWNPARLAEVTNCLLGEEGVRQRRGLRRVRERLGSPGASRRAAEAVAEYLERDRD